MEKNKNLTAIRRLQFLIRLHIESYNFSIFQGLRLIVYDFFRFLKSPLNFGVNFISELIDFHLSKPCYFNQGKRKRIIPRQTKEAGFTYKGDFLTSISFFRNQERRRKRIVFKCGELPIMVKSSKCHLFQLKPKQMVEIDEEEYEMGGYFILNGNERILRLLIVPRRNVVQAISRIRNTQRGTACSVFSCSIRSVDRIQTSRTLHLHYLISGGIHVRILLRKQEFFIPVVIILKALRDISDREVLERITNFDYKDKFLRDRALIMIKEGYEKCEKLEKIKARNFLGKIFRIALPFEKLSNQSLGELIISKFILIHLGENNQEKQTLLFFMIQKLLSLRKGIICEDNPDSIENQEFLLPGNLVMVYLRERIENSLTSFIFSFKNFAEERGEEETRRRKFFLKKNLTEKIFLSIPKGLEKMLSTGNFVSGFKNELSQTSGLSVNIERLNFSRFLSYFRSIHRGKFFLDLKNTSGRKLFPQNWGFICPVHTPDGAPCGILNHLTSSVISSIFNPIEKKFVQKFIRRFGIYNSVFKKKKKI